MVIDYVSLQLRTQMSITRQISKDNNNKRQVSTLANGLGSSRKFEN